MTTAEDLEPMGNNAKDAMGMVAPFLSFLSLSSVSQPSGAVTTLWAKATGTGF